MNIKEAKNEIQNAMKAYFTKDEFGNYVIPIERQRPVFLMGAPGIGKTAIMEQIAAELGVSLVTYSMTHHTRQSAIGLPFIERKEYSGKEYDVSEYTMSEIIASVYDMIEKTGKDEGILFLDEVNCVSETLSPAMLQFLQYKIFGRHRVPDGWIVVTAGNPPEYNNSVREFDIVTWDRLKRIDVEPDFEAWKEYAYKKGIHASIITYLDIKKSDFYKIETTVDGKSFVTARGWSDLSDMIHLYEQNDIKVTEKFIAQYIQNKKIAKSFANYYDLFNKYKSDYQIDTILNGKAGDRIKVRAKNAKFDERFSLLGLLLDAITNEVRNVYKNELSLTELLNSLTVVKFEIGKSENDAAEALNKQITKYQEMLSIGKSASSLSSEDEFKYHLTISTLESISKGLINENQNDNNKAFEFIKECFNKQRDELKKCADVAGKKLSEAFKFCEDVFGEGQEVLILVTELTMNYYGSHFISRYGCKEYFNHNKELLFHERQKEIIAEIETISLDD